MATENSYDAVPYPSYAFYQSQPDVLAATATLFGLDAPDPTTGRVLEIAGASGGNILPLAWRHPRAEHVCMDLSPRQIEEAERRKHALGLKNVRFVTADLRDIDESWGEFDFIVAHGVYSWVPAEVQGEIMRVCRERLSPHGIAYISYNTWPGWQLQGVLRDMMLYFSRNAQTPRERVARARSLLKFLSEAVPERNAAYSRVLRGAAQSLSNHTDAYLIHEYLEENNLPVTFSEFMERATGAGLQYLGEASLAAMLDQHLGDTVSKQLREWSGGIFELEQYMDYVRNRTFRQTLLVHSERKIQRDLRGFKLEGWQASTRARPNTPPSVQNDDPVAFRDTRGFGMELRDPVHKAMLKRLAEASPASLPLESLVASAAEDVLGSGFEPDQLRLRAAQSALYFYSTGLIELHLEPIRCAPKAGEAPTAWEYARWQVGEGLRLATVRHETVDLDADDHKLLGLLDGTHTRTELLRIWNREVDELEELTGTTSERRMDLKKLNERLETFAYWGLLVA